MSIRSALTRRAETISSKLVETFGGEDFVRVYPDGVAYWPYLPIGIRRPLTWNDRRNFLDHQKFYAFCSQFVDGRIVCDIGCGSGHGCKLLKTSRAKKVYGIDISKHAIRFAERHYSEFAVFSQASATNMQGYPNDVFDMIVCSEVLEHIKDRADDAIREMKRTTINDGLIIIGTPNTEMLPTHGFSFDEIANLLKQNFREFHIFENALIPFGDAKGHWIDRRAKEQVGVIVTENVNLEETALPKGANPELKTGIQPGVLNLGSLRVDTTHLHNTQSWLILAINRKE